MGCSRDRQERSYEEAGATGESTARIPWRCVLSCAMHACARGPSHVEINREQECRASYNCAWRRMPNEGRFRVWRAESGGAENDGLVDSWRGSRDRRVIRPDAGESAQAEDATMKAWIPRWCRRQRRVAQSSEGAGGVGGCDGQGWRDVVSSAIVSHPCRQCGGVGRRGVGSGSRRRNRGLSSRMYATVHPLAARVQGLGRCARDAGAGGGSLAVRCDGGADRQQVRGVAGHCNQSIRPRLCSLLTSTKIAERHQTKGGL